VPQNCGVAARSPPLTYPIDIDNDFAIWRAFGNDARPAKYLFDNRGRLARRWVGEGNYDEIDGEIRRLLTAACASCRAASVRFVCMIAVSDRTTLRGLTQFPRRSSKAGMQPLNTNGIMEH
jgi:hypothetical protein